MVASSRDCTARSRNEVAVPNLLGSLGSFEVDPNQDLKEVVGMRHASGFEGPGNYPPGHPLAQKGPSVGPPAEPRSDVEPVKSAPPTPTRLSPEEVAERLGDIEAGLGRLERAKTRGQDTTALIAQLRNEQFAPLLGEFVTLKRLEIRQLLQSMMRPEWSRQVATINLNLFDAVWQARLLGAGLLAAAPETFPGIARATLDTLRTSWPKEQISPEARSAA